MKKSAKTLICKILVAVLVLGMFAMTTGTQAYAEATQPFYGGWPYSTMPTGHFNMFVANAIELKYFREVHQLPLATYVAANDEYVPMLATAWEASEDGTNFHVSLRNDVTWLSGDAFTSKDVWTTFMIYRLVANPVWNYIDGVEMTSDYEVDFAVKNSTSLLMRYVLRKPMVDFVTYGEYAQKVQDLLTAGKTEESDEWKALATDFNNFRPELVNATGPYYLDAANVSESCVILAKNESSFLADTVNFSEIVVYNGDVAELTPLILSGEVDFLTHQFPAASMETFVAMGYGARQVAGVDGIALYFNEEYAPLDKVEVRQALAYIIDRVRVGELALPGVSRGTKYITGLGDAMTENWVDESLLIDYTVDLAKAEELLLKAGLTKNDSGKWCKEDGTPFTLELQCPTGWSDASTASAEVAQQLTAFGITTTIDGIDSTMRQSNITAGEYQVACSFFGTGQPHPMFAYETPLLVSNLNAAKGLGYPMVQNTESCGEVDLAALITASTSGWDLDAQKDAVQKIAQTVNETVPYLPLYTKWSKYVTSEGLRTTWGADESLYMNSAGDDSFVVIQILNGQLAPIA